MKKHTLSVVFSLFALLFPFVTALAQEDFNDDVQDVPTAPIDDYLPFMMIGAIAIAAYFLYQKTQVNKKINN